MPREIERGIARLSAGIVLLVFGPALGDERTPQSHLSELARHLVYVCVVVCGERGHC